MDVPHGTIHESPKKIHVRNQAQPKINMETKYAIQEALGVCT